MNQQEFDQLTQSPRIKQRISVEDFANKSDRTLILGYTNEKHLFHLYLQNQRLHRVIYNFENELVDDISGSNLLIEHCRPNKEAYPESCDFEFCRLLKQQSAEPAFIAFDKTRYQRVRELQFHGVLLSKTHDFREIDKAIDAYIISNPFVPHKADIGWLGIEKQLGYDMESRTYLRICDSVNLLARNAIKDCIHKQYTAFSYEVIKRLTGTASAIEYTIKSELMDNESFDNFKFDETIQIACRDRLALFHEETILGHKLNLNQESVEEIDSQSLS